MFYLIKIYLTKKIKSFKIKSKENEILNSKFWIIVQISIEFRQIFCYLGIIINTNNLNEYFNIEKIKKIYYLHI